MKTFKTPKGTELPLMDIKGKDYLLVPHRVVWFREEFPFGKIETALVESSDKHAMYKATISVPWDQTYRVLSMATKREDAAHFPDFHEKAETSAIGRALALCGYGTQFAHELEEGERLVDSPLQKPIVKTTDISHQPMPKSAVTPKAQHTEAITAMTLGNRVFDIGKWKGISFKELAFGKKSEALSYANFARSQIKEKGLVACHTDLTQFVAYMDIIGGD